MASDYCLRAAKYIAEVAYGKDPKANDVIEECPSQADILQEFEDLLWRWFNAQTELRYLREETHPDPHDMHCARVSANTAYDAVILAFTREPMIARVASEVRKIFEMSAGGGAV